MSRKTILYKGQKTRVLTQVKLASQGLRVSVENGERMDNQAETVTQDRPDREEKPDSQVLPDNLVLQEKEDKDGSAGSPGSPGNIATCKGLNFN